MELAAELERTVFDVETAFRNILKSVSERQKAEPKARGYEGPATSLAREWGTLPYEERLEIRALVAEYQRSVDLFSKITPWNKIYLVMFHREEFLRIDRAINSLRPGILALARCIEDEDSRSRIAWERVASRSERLRNQSPTPFEDYDASKVMRVDWETFRPMNGD
jgi:hypothetical protein